MIALLTLFVVALVLVMLAPPYYYTRLSLDWRFWCLSDLGRDIWASAVVLGHALPADPLVMRRRLGIGRAHPWATRRQRQKMLRLGVLEYVHGHGDKGFVRLKSRATWMTPAPQTPRGERASCSPGQNERDKHCRVGGAPLSRGKGQARVAPAPPSSQVIGACSVTGDTTGDGKERKDQRKKVFEEEFSVGSFVKEPPDLRNARGARVQPLDWGREVCPESPEEGAARREILARAAGWGPALPSTLATLAEYVRRRPQLAVAWVLHLDGNPAIRSPWGCLLHAIRQGWAPPQRDEDAARPLVKPPRLGADRGVTRLGGVLEGLLERRT